MSCSFALSDSKSSRCSPGRRDRSNLAIPQPFKSEKNEIFRQNSDKKTLSSEIFPAETGNKGGNEPSFENATSSALDSPSFAGLQFLDVPKGDDIRINNLKIEDKYFLFGVFSALMSFLQPGEFPSEILRDALQRKTPSHLLIFQIVKLELIALIWMTFWALLSVCLPVGVVANFVFSPANARRFDDTEDFPNDSLDTSKQWTERSLGCLLHVLLLLLFWFGLSVTYYGGLRSFVCEGLKQKIYLGLLKTISRIWCPIILILAANEEISRAISQSPGVTGTMYDDVNTFVRNSHMQISFVATSSTDIVFEAIRKDLEDIHLLLGIPYQNELAEETGINTALGALDELKEETTKISSVMSELLSDCETARKASSSLQTQLKEVALQLVVAKQQCTMQDRALCYTLQFTGFDVSLPLDNVTHDIKIQQLENLNKDGNLNISIQLARQVFSAIPDQIALVSSQFVADAKAILTKRRTDVYKATHDLDVLSRIITSELESGQKVLMPIIHKVTYWDFWRWIAVLAIVATLSIVWGLFLCGTPCGCGMTSRTVPLLMSGLTLACLMVWVLWGLGSATLFLGGNGQCLICHPLYDHPQYKVLSDLLDNDGILYEKNGFLNMFAFKNDSLKVGSVIKGCQRDQTIYETFHLHNYLDVEKTLNYQSWEDLKALFSNFTFTETRFQITSPSLLLNLQILSSISMANFTNHRQQFSVTSVTKKDVGSFADQLNTVARQLSDPVTARKIDNLAFNLRKLVNTELQTLNEIRSKILYKLTTLEVLLPTLNRHINQSLSHLKTIEFFLDNQGWQIAERTRRKFIAQIENYLESLYGHASAKITDEIGKCHPLWQIYHTARVLICRLVVDPLNGMTFSSFFLIFMFIVITPAVMKTVDFYREVYDDMFTSVSHRHSRDDLIIDDEGTWATPSSDSPPTRRTPPDEGPIVAWRTPTPSRMAVEESRVPPPPRQPSTVSATMAPQRVPQIESIARVRSPRSKLTSLASRIPGTRHFTQNLPSVSRARTPRRGHESLRLVEPIRWKSGSTTPKSWI